MVEYLLLESGDRLVLEDGSGDLLLESGGPPPAGDYLVQEEDGVSRFTLEDGTGFILLESGPPPPGPSQPTGGGRVIEITRTPVRPRRSPFDTDDEGVALTLLTALRHRYRLKRP